jgi:hypothetical protein
MKSGSAACLETDLLTAARLGLRQHLPVNPSHTFRYMWAKEATVEEDA